MGLSSAEVDLTPYVPRIAAAWTRERPESSWTVVDGSLLFADVSGFTALSERLAKRGPIGAEELTDVLGAAFAELLAVAYAEGGSLLKFGGDALLLLFDGADHEARAPRAAAGMRASLRQMGKLRTSVGEVQLRMSQGVHSGELHFFRVGVSHKELVVAGPGTTAVVTMEAAANAGEILLSATTAAALERDDPRLLGASRETGRLLRMSSAHRTDGFQRAEAGIAGDDGAACNIAAAVRAHLQAGGCDESEHRHVPIAFLHFDGTDALLATSGPAGLADALDELVSTTQQAVEAEEVTFLGTDIDKDGGKIILVAGAPRALEDAEGRLLRAVRRITDAGCSLPIRSGVNRGHVFAGCVGPPYRKSYTVMGDAVNLAARLMAKASPGQIIVHPDVLVRSRTRFVRASVEPFTVKGKKHPVKAYLLGEVHGTQETRVGAQAPLVGRDHEIGTLMDQVANGGVVEIVGDVGTGKTRLLEELRTRAGGRNPVRVVTCEHYERTTPYFAVRVLLRHVLGITLSGDEGAAELEQVLAALPGGDALVRWAPLLGDVLGLPVPETDETRTLEAKFRRQRTTHVIVDALAAATGTVAGKTVLAFDDTQWMDDPSHEVVKRLVAVADEGSWTVCLARRPSGGEQEALAGVRVTLAGLDGDAARSLVTRLTDDDPLPPYTVDAIVERADGNPLFLEELARMAQRSDGSAFPDSLEAVVAAEIDALPPPERRLLRHAAVLGTSFDPALFAEVVGDTHLVAPDLICDRLHGVVEVTRDGRVQFRHRLIRDVAYNALPFGVRKELHRRAAQAMQQLGPDAVVTHAEVLSVHCMHAGDAEGCWTYAGMAARRATEKHALVEAEELYKRAIAAARQIDGIGTEEVVGALLALATVRDVAGRYTEAHDALRVARRLAGDRPETVALLCAKHAKIANRLNRPVSGVRWVSRGLRSVDGVQTPEASEQRAQLLVLYGLFRLRAGRPKEALQWCARAADEANRSGNRRALAEAYWVTDAAHVALGSEEQGSYARRAAVLFEEIGEEQMVANTMLNLGATAYYQGRWSEALELYERSRSHFERVGDLVEAGLSSCNVAEIFADRGRLDEARARLDETIAMWRALRFPVGLALATRHLGRIALRAGDVAGALEHFHDARAVFVEQSLQPKVVEVDTWIAECLLRQGDVDEAQRLLTNVLAHEVSTGSTEMRAMAHRLRACAAAATGDIEGAWTEVDESLARARERNAPYEVALALGVMAKLVVVVPTVDLYSVEAERAAILAALGVDVEPPPLPLPLPLQPLG